MFSESHNLDIPTIVRRLNLKPMIRVEAGQFVAHLEDQRYVLGQTEAGIRSAVREAIQLCADVRRSCGRLAVGRKRLTHEKLLEKMNY
jgi:hypothetical protein